MSSPKRHVCNYIVIDITKHPYIQVRGHPIGHHRSRVPILGCSRPAQIELLLLRTSKCCCLDAWMCRGTGCAGGGWPRPPVEHAAEAGSANSQRHRFRGCARTISNHLIVSSIRYYSQVPPVWPAGRAAAPRSGLRDGPTTSTIHNPQSTIHITPQRPQFGPKINKHRPNTDTYAPPSGNRLSASPPRLQQPPLFPSTDICMYIHTHTYDTRREVNESNFFSSLAVQLGVPRAALRPWF